MAESRKVTKLFGAAGAALLALSGAALADGYEGSIKDAPADEGRKFTYSFSITGTSDYVFRGISQTDNDPTLQGAINIGYGIFYAGVWGSGLDFEYFGNDAEVELDWYGGIKPTWGPLTFDFGIIYYTYPGSNYVGGVPPELPYIEYKAGVSGSPITNLALGATVYYSDDSYAETGEVWTVEGTAAYTFHAIGPFTPTISGTVGHVEGDDPAYLTFNGFDSYTYWNAGIALAVEKLTFDFRYWDTDGAENPVSTTGFSSCVNDLCGERFVFSATVALP
ncbi:hypothetical protein GIW81_16165 [Hyphomicrobium sp. xq]|uniref:Porin n=1 Tax=Hyphomicrobium album TaxID=2665159 RepID=A0A6I3KL52_9HYPH|nr:TorF family putative porin [Hyphomicrobium album]MTD95874.1 hypothetical protein [Hyphomicrobium album]